MRRAIVVIGGFRQDIEDRTGSGRLAKSLMEKFTRNDGHDDMVLVFYKEWHDDWKSFAGFLNLNGFSDAFVCAFSWGAGFGLREFGKRFLGPITCVLCDPVFHSKFPWMNWKAITKIYRPTIKLPPNVRVVKWFYQKMDTPGDDQVESPNPLPKRTRLSVPHTQCDDHPAYHEACISEIQYFLKTGDN